MTDEELFKKQAEIDARRGSAAPSFRGASPALQAEIDELMKIARQAETAEDIEKRRQTALAADQQEQLAARQRATSPGQIEFALKCAGVGERHRKLVLLLDLIPEPLRAWVDGFPDSLSGASAILAGPTGTGKTTAAIWAMIQAYLSGHAERREWRAPSMQFVSSPELFARVFAKEPLDRFEHCDLLIVDDWGMAYESDWPLAAMDRLVDRRWSENRATIVTTNLHPCSRERGDESFESRYPRVFSRLADSSGPGVVTLAREDLRRKRA